MMKTKLKFFLVLLAMMVGGVNDAWAQSTVGATDNSTAYFGATSTEQTLSFNKKLHYEFTNYTDKAQNYHNWLLCLDNISGLSNSFILRADNWWFCGSNNPGEPFSGDLSGKIITFSSNIDWDHFIDDMNGAKVVLDISYLNYGYQIVIRVTATNNGRVYTETLKFNHNPSSNPTIRAKLSIDHSHLVISREEITNLEVSWNDFTGASTLDNSKFESQNSSEWVFDSGYKNNGNGWRTFSIKNLQNGDQVIITYEKTSDPNAEVGTNYDAATFLSTNSIKAKTPTGDYVNSTTVVESETPYTVCQDGTLTLNVHRRTVIKSIEINRSTIDPNPRVEFTNTPSTSYAVGADFPEPTLTVSPATATAYYSSSDPSVAVVDRETGEVTLVGVGTVRITATAIIGSNTPTDYYDLEVTSATLTTTEYDFTGSGANCALEVASTTSSVKILDFSDITYNLHSYGSLADRIAVGADESLGGQGARWYLSNAGIYNNLGYTGSFYILDLKNGDIVSIEYSADDLDATHHCGSSSLASTNAVTSDTWQTNTNTTNTIVYTIKENGALKLNIGKLTYIKKITIEHETEPSFHWSDANLNPKFDTSGGGKKLRYKITDMNFTEPIAVKQPAEASHTVRSLNHDVAIEDTHTPGDILLVNTGTVNIQGTMKANKIISGVETDYDYCDTYTVDVWADVATFTDVNNRYEVTGIGKLQEKEVTAVRGLKMNFGSDEDATLVLYNTDYNAFVAYSINKLTGWRHRDAGDEYSIPTHGSFYKFKALTSGKLRFSGVKNGDENEVVLMDAGNGVTEAITGSPLCQIEADQIGIKGSSDNSLSGNDYVHLTAGHTYYLFGTVPANGDYYTHEWSAYLLTWFSFESDFKLVNIVGGVETEVSYGAAARTDDNDITDVSNVVTIKGVTNPTVSVVGKSGNITAATPNTTSSGDNSILNVTGISGSGGAIRIKIESSAGTAYFTLTIPYATHTWDFRTGTRTGENAENGQTRAALATEIKSHGINDDPTNYPTGAALGLSGVTRVYRSSNKTAAGVWEHILDPLLVANGNVEGDNSFYIDKTSGLIFVTGAQSFGALETKCHWNGADYTSYDPNHVHGLTDIDDETEYYLGPDVTTEAEYVYMKAGSKIIFPGVRPGQYIKIYTRRLSSLGDHWRAENLIDLEDKPYTSSGEFQYLGINEDRSSTDGTPDAWAGNNLKGSAIFKVPVTNNTTGSTAYNANNTDISQMPSLTVTNGWVRILKIEILNEYKTDLYLSETNSNGFFKVDYDSEYASAVVYKKNGVAIAPVSKFYEGTVGKIGATHAHTCDYEVVKIPTTLDVTVTSSTSGNGPVYNNITLTFNGGNGLVKVIQREYGDDTGVNNRADQHIINKKETYIAVSEVNVQDYPYTWDFTTHNMFQRGSSTTSSLTSATGTDYGTWTNPEGNTFQVNANATVNTSMEQLNTSPSSYEQVTKPLFAQGGQLSIGSTAVAEVKGLGISRPNGALRNMYTWKTTAGNFGRATYQYKTFNLTTPIAINGSTLSGAGTITIPQVPNGMYIFVSATGNGPIWGQVTAGGTVIPWTDTFWLKGGVWCYYQNSGSTGDVVIPLNDGVQVKEIAVTNIVKSINELGYASESRAHAIDHTYQNKFTRHPVKAYAITTYGGETYNYKGYPQVKKSSDAVTIVPANTGIVLFENKDDVVMGENEGTYNQAAFSSPLFYPAVNNATQTDADATILATNWMAPNVESTIHTSETENKGGTSCTKFIMTRTFFTYDTSNVGNDEEHANTNVEAFYRLRIMNNDEEDEIGANKAYLLIPTANLPTALWNGGNGIGVAGHARQGVIFLDLEDFEENESTVVDNPIVDRSTDNNLYYSISGARISGKPTTKGIYIHNGKKISVK